MTTNELAAGYHRKCVDRLAALDVLHARHAHSDVVRESQEVVELALKGMLRWAGVDPPKIHDVGDLLLEVLQCSDAMSASLPTWSAITMPIVTSAVSISRVSV